MPRFYVGAGDTNLIPVCMFASAVLTETSSKSLFIFLSLNCKVNLFYLKNYLHFLTSWINLSTVYLSREDIYFILALWFSVKDFMLPCMPYFFGIRDNAPRPFFLVTPRPFWGTQWVPIHCRIKECIVCILLVLLTSDRFTILTLGCFSCYTFSITSWENVHMRCFIPSLWGTDVLEPHWN